MQEIDGRKPASWWRKIKNGEVAAIRDGGRTLIVINWPPGMTLPPRETRPPSYAELLEERLTNPPPPKVMPRGRHLGRPRKHPPPG